MGQADEQIINVEMTTLDKSTSTDHEADESFEHDVGCWIIMDVVTQDLDENAYELLQDEGSRNFVNLVNREICSSPEEATNNVESHEASDHGGQENDLNFKTCDIVEDVTNSVEPNELLESSENDLNFKNCDLVEEAASNVEIEEPSEH